jgi:hypothetical protein
MKGTPVAWDIFYGGLEISILHFVIKINRNLSRSFGDPDPAGSACFWASRIRTR